MLFEFFFDNIFMFGSILTGIGNIIGAGASIWNGVQSQRNQEIQWQREDNAVQRRVKDLEAAGLSKTLAAGSPASSTTSPKAGQVNESAIAKALDIQSLQNMRLQNQKLKAEIRANDASIAKTQADTLNVQANTQGQNIQNSISAFTQSKQSEQYQLDSAKTQAEIEQIGKNIELSNSQIDKVTYDCLKLDQEVRALEAQYPGIAIGIEKNMSTINMLNALSQKYGQDYVNAKLDEIYKNIQNKTEDVKFAHNLLVSMSNLSTYYGTTAGGGANNILQLIQNISGNINPANWDLEGDITRNYFQTIEKYFDWDHDFTQNGSSDVIKYDGYGHVVGGNKDYVQMYNELKSQGYGTW